MLEGFDVEITLARQDAERWLGFFLTTFAAMFSFLNLGQILGGSRELGSWSVFIVATLYMVFYAQVWRQAIHRAPTRQQVYVRTTLEVSVPLWVSLVDAQLGADYALPRVSVLVWAIAIFVSVLRLRPELALWAGGLAAFEWISLWFWLSPDAAADSLHAVAGPAVNRAMLFLACGVLAWRVALMQAALTQKTVRTALERERVRRAFGAYLPEVIVQRILDGELRVGTERRPVTVMFVDIRSFTSFAEGRSADEVLEVLNEALEAFSEEVREQGGFVNKYLGDGLMAIFGAPVDHEDHAAAAVRAALAISDAADRLSAAGVYPGLRIGIGLHCGDALVGDIGGGGYREYTAIGDVVNVAARVENYTKTLSGSVAATDEVRRAAADAAVFSSVGIAELRGRGEPVELWEVHAPHHETGPSAA